LRENISTVKKHQRSNKAKKRIAIDGLKEQKASRLDPVNLSL
jgi:hypothetical protein